ncbi:MAG: DUF2924 domain-containing protein [Anaerolineae bacterium]|nr:DUF2924 domain-containing protein [Anaerolineae bacterium]
MTDSLLARIARLNRLSIDELRGQWRDLFNREPPRYSRTFLEQTLAYRLQELAYGGLSNSVQRKLEALAEAHAQRPHGKRRAASGDKRPTAGTRLVREWKGVEHTVVVLADGFDYQGRKYKSLSAIARHIAGTRWNGLLFFGLRSTRRAA